MMKSTPHAATAAGDLPHCNLRLGAALVMRSPGARKASLGSGSPQTPPKAGPVAAIRRSKATPRPRVGRPATSAAGRIRRPQPCKTSVSAGGGYLDQFARFRVGKVRRGAVGAFPHTSGFHAHAAFDPARQVMATDGDGSFRTSRGS